VVVRRSFKESLAPNETDLPSGVDGLSLYRISIYVGGFVKTASSLLVFGASAYTCTFAVDGHSSIFKAPRGCGRDQSCAGKKEGRNKTTEDPHGCE
jgi:hypothetical protein